MSAADKFDTKDAMAVALLCAKCKKPVKAGEAHTCGEHSKAQPSENIKSIIADTPNDRLGLSHSTRFPISSKYVN